MANGERASWRRELARRVVLVVPMVAGLNVIAAVEQSRVVLAGHGDAYTAIEALPQVTGDDVTMMGTPGTLELVPLWVCALAVVPALVLAGAQLAAAVLLARVVGGIGSGNSFSTRSQRAARHIGLALLGGSAASVALDAVAGRAIDVTASGQGVLFAIEPPSLPVLFIVLGLVALALAYAVSDGAALEREVEGVV